MCWRRFNFRSTGKWATWRLRPPQTLSFLQRTHSARSAHQGDMALNLATTLVYLEDADKTEIRICLASGKNPTHALFTRCFCTRRIWHMPGTTTSLSDSKTGTMTWEESTSAQSEKCTISFGNSGQTSFTSNSTPRHTKYAKSSGHLHSSQYSPCRCGQVWPSPHCAVNLTASISVDRVNTRSVALPSTGGPPVVA